MDPEEEKTEEESSPLPVVSREKTESRGERLLRLRKENPLSPTQSESKEADPQLVRRQRRGFSMPKIGNPLAGVSGKFSGLKLPGGWYIWVIGLVALLAGGYYLQSGGAINLVPDNRVFQLNGVPGLTLSITFAHLALAGLCLWGLLEAQDREDPFWLDWWVPYVFAAVFVYGQANWATIISSWGSAMWWGGFAGGAVILLTVAVLWNPSEEEEESWVDRIDTTALFNATMVLVILHFANFSYLPYPKILPFTAVLIVGALALIKEMGRTPKFAMVVIGLGVVAAVVHTWVAVALTLAAAVVLATLATHQAWIPGSKRRTEVTQSVPGIGKGLKLIKSWDVAIAWWATFVVVSLVLYGNYVLAVIGGR